MCSFLRHCCVSSGQFSSACHYSPFSFCAEFLFYPCCLAFEHSSLPFLLYSVSTFQFLPTVHIQNISRRCHTFYLCSFFQYGSLPFLPVLLLLFMPILPCCSHGGGLVLLCPFWTRKCPTRTGTRSTFPMLTLHCTPYHHPTIYYCFRTPTLPVQ